MSWALKAISSKHWTTREFPYCLIKNKNTSWINSPGALDCNSNTVKELTLGGKVIYAWNNSSLPKSQANGFLFRAMLLNMEATSHG